MSDVIATAAENERIVELVGSGVWHGDDGSVEVSIRPQEEPWTPETGLRLTEDDALALADALREAARLVAGSEPQEFIRVAILEP